MKDDRPWLELTIRGFLHVVIRRELVYASIKVGGKWWTYATRKM